MSDRIPFQVPPSEDGVRVSGFIERDSKGAPVITSLTVVCTPEHSMGQLVRELRLGALLQQNLSGPAPTTTARTPTGPRHGGRQPLDDALLRSVAEAYLRETAYGQPPGAMKRLAAEFGRPEETLRTWVGRARSRGWLGPSRRGRRGAEPGPRLTA